MRVQLWHATVGGGLFGLVVGVAMEFAREIEQHRAINGLIQEFEPWSPPLWVNMLRPHVIPAAACITFAALASFAYIFQSRRQ